MPSGVNFTSGGVPVAAANETAAIEPLQKPSGVSGRFATTRNCQAALDQNRCRRRRDVARNVLTNRLHQVAGREAHAHVAPLRDGQLARRVHLRQHHAHRAVAFQPRTRRADLDDRHARQDTP